MTKCIQLHCPSTGDTIDDFIITPYQTNTQILQTVRNRFGIPYAGLYNIDAKPITHLQAVEDSIRVLVAASESEEILPDAPVEFVLYDGEEGEDVDPDAEFSTLR